MSSKNISLITFPREVVLFYNAYRKASHKTTYSLTFCMRSWELNPDPWACKASHLPLNDIPATTNIFNNVLKEFCGLDENWMESEGISHPHMFAAFIAMTKFSRKLT